MGHFRDKVKLQIYILGNVSINELFYLQNYYVDIGQRDHFSEIDIKKLLLTYNCPDIKKTDKVRSKKKSSLKRQRIKARQSGKKSRSKKQRTKKYRKSPKRKSPKKIASLKKQKKTKIRVSKGNLIKKINARRHMNFDSMSDDDMSEMSFEYEHDIDSLSSFNKRYPPPMIYLLIYPDFYFHNHDN